jgi:hypothetical protein
MTIISVTVSKQNWKSTGNATIPHVSSIRVVNIMPNSAPTGREIPSLRIIYNQVSDNVCLINIQYALPILAMTGF